MPVSVSRPVTVNDVLDGHVTLEIESLDRLYLTLWVPQLVMPGQVATFPGRHQGLAIPSPATMERLGTRFRQAVPSFARNNGVPVLCFAKDERKIERVRPLLERAEHEGRSRVVAIAVAQEYQNVSSAARGSSGRGPVRLPARRAAGDLLLLLPAG